MARRASRGAARKKDSEYPVKVDRNVYPRPEYRFPDVKIGLTYKDSAADFPKPLPAPEAAPNVLLVLLDDIGFGWSSAFGGLARMPTAERLARNGLKYNQLHTTALCSPTRAALLTGRNHHSAHSGNIGELATGFPGYDGIIPRSCATIAEILHENGYASGWWGKNHNVPDNQTSGPAPSTTGPRAEASTTSTVSSAARPTSSIPRCTGGRAPSPCRASPRTVTT
jgi:arylsulfatase